MERWLGGAVGQKARQAGYQCGCVCGGWKWEEARQGQVMQQGEEWRPGWGQWWTWEEAEQGKGLQLERK